MFRYHDRKVAWYLRNLFNGIPSLSYYIPSRLKRQNKNFDMKFPKILTESMLEIVCILVLKTSLTIDFDKSCLANKGIY